MQGERPECPGLRVSGAHRIAFSGTDGQRVSGACIHGCQEHSPKERRTANHSLIRTVDPRRINVRIDPLVGKKEGIGIAPTPSLR